MSSERAPLSAHSDASVTRGAGALELMLAKGIYTANCLRPKAGLEAQYAPIWRDYHAIQSAADLDGRFLTDAEIRTRKGLRHRMRTMEQVIWKDVAPNTVATVGKNLALDTFLAGSSYTVVGPYLGLISSTSYTATAAGDTMASHSGWLEAGNANTPTYTSPRKTAAWSAASAGAKALSSALSFAITGSGTVKGAFLVYGTGAVTTIDNTSGTLMSAGVFSGGDKVVANLDTLNVSYSLAF